MTINIRTLLFVCVMSFSLQTYAQDWTYNFKEAVHESVYDENDSYVGKGPIAKKYGNLVYTDMDTIDMVDPSGGPYITLHQDLSWLSEEFKGLCVGSLVPIDTGFRIGTYGKYDHLADTKIIGGIINTSE